MTHLFLINMTYKYSPSQNTSKQSVSHEDENNWEKNDLQTETYSIRNLCIVRSLGYDVVFYSN